MAAFGESVMKGAVSQLQAGGFTVDAAGEPPGLGDGRRHPAGQGGATSSVRSSSSRSGTNGTLTDGQVDAIVAAMPADTRLYFMTVKAQQPWIASNNDRIRNIPTKYPNVGVIDWEARSAEIADQLSVSDGGAHLRTKKAMQFYANMIFEAIGRPDLGADRSRSNPRPDVDASAPAGHTC